MASVELQSQLDYARKALSFYRKNKQSGNPMVLSLGVHAVEQSLKGIVEVECGYMPEHLSTHYLLDLCTEINKMKIPHFHIEYDFQQKCKGIQRYYNGARYYNPNNHRANVFDDYDFRVVKETVALAEEKLNSYLVIHEKNVAKEQEEREW